MSNSVYSKYNALPIVSDVSVQEAERVSNSVDSLDLLREVNQIANLEQSEIELSRLSRGRRNPLSQEDLERMKLDQEIIASNLSISADIILDVLGSDDINSLEKVPKRLKKQIFSALKKQGMKPAEINKQFSKTMEDGSTLDDHIENVCNLRNCLYAYRLIRDFSQSGEDFSLIQEEDAVSFPKFVLARLDMFSANEVSNSDLLGNADIYSTLNPKAQISLQQLCLFSTLFVDSDKAIELDQFFHVLALIPTKKLKFILDSFFGVFIEESITTEGGQTFTKTVLERLESIIFKVPCGSHSAVSALCAIYVLQELSDAKSFQDYVKDLKKHLSGDIIEGLGRASLNGSRFDVLECDSVWQENSFSSGSINMSMDILFGDNKQEGLIEDVDLLTEVFKERLKEDGFEQAAKDFELTYDQLVIVFKIANFIEIATNNPKILDKLNAAKTNKKKVGVLRESFKTDLSFSATDIYQFCVSGDHESMFKYKNISYTQWILLIYLNFVSGDPNSLNPRIAKEIKKLLARNDLNKMMSELQKNKDMQKILDDVYRLIENSDMNFANIRLSNRTYPKWHSFEIPYLDVIFTTYEEINLNNPLHCLMVSALKHHGKPIKSFLCEILNDFDNPHLPDVQFVKTVEGNPLGYVLGTKFIMSSCIRPTNAANSTATANFFGAGSAGVIPFNVKSRDSKGEIQKLGCLGAFECFPIEFNYSPQVSSSTRTVTLVEGETGLEIRDFNPARSNAQPGKNVALNMGGAETGGGCPDDERETFFDYARKMYKIRGVSDTIAFTSKRMDHSERSTDPSPEVNSAEISDWDSIIGDRLYEEGSSNPTYMNLAYFGQGVIDPSDYSLLVVNLDNMDAPEIKYFVDITGKASAQDTPTITLKNYEYLRYIFSWPKGEEFIPFSGAITFEAKSLSTDLVKKVIDLLFPEWFFSSPQPIEIKSRKWTGEEMVQVRTPEGVFIEADGKVVDVLRIYQDLGYNLNKIDFSKYE